MAQLTSTRIIFDETKAYINKSQTSLATLQRQISSGKRFDSFEQMTGSVSRVKGLQDAVGRIDSYMSSITRVKPRVQATDNALEQLINRASSLRDNLLLRQTPSGDSLDLEQIAEDMLSEVESLLNTKIDGHYIFAGSKTDTAPIRSNLEIVANYSSTDPLVTNSNYYVGDGNSLSLRIADGREVDFNITADNAAFQQLISAAHLAKAAHLSEESQDFQLASEQLTLALDGLSSLRGENGNVLATMEDAFDTHDKARLSLAEQISDIEDTDIVQASIDVAFNETILQATFQSFARINQLRLLDFLQ